MKKRTEDQIFIEKFAGENKIFNEENFATFVKTNGQDISVGYLMAMNDICASLKEILHPTQGGHKGTIETGAMVRSKVQSFLDHKQSALEILNSKHLNSNENKPLI